jgi:hypothetical protein
MYVGSQMVGVVVEEGISISREEVKGLTLDSEQFNQDGITWEDGMNLPGQPSFFETTE